MTDANEFVPIVRRVALARNVLVVAETRADGMWKAYCDAVPGMNHDNEWQEVVRVGCQVSRRVARAMFPEFEEREYAR
jgi:hypothetical protein